MNRTSQNAPQGGPAPSFSFDTSNNRIAGMANDAAGNLANDGVHNYQYDAEGNLVKVDGGQTASYVFSALNRRKEIRSGNGSVQEVAYNIDGKRVSIWDGTTGNMVQAQTYWESLPVAYYKEGQIHFQHQDWLGSERITTSYTAAVETASAPTAATSTPTTSPSSTTTTMEPTSTPSSANCRPCKAGGCPPTPTRKLRPH